MRIVKIGLDAANRFLPKYLYNSIYVFARKVLWAGQRLSIKYKLFIAAVLNGAESRKLTLIDELLPYTMGGALALSSTFDIVSMAEKNQIKGDLVECGVAKGGCAAMMALASRELRAQRKLWLFDSYEGLPEPSEKDFLDGRVGEMIGPISRGMLVGTVKQVRALMFDRCRIPEEDVIIVEGWFQDTLPASRNSIEEIAVLRLDGDWYESTKCCLDNLYDKVTSGGFVIIDDYATCYGSERAVAEFMGERNVAPKLIPDGRGGAWFEKP